MKEDYGVEHGGVYHAEAAPVAPKKQIYEEPQTFQYISLEAKEAVKRVVENYGLPNSSKPQINEIILALQNGDKKTANILLKKVVKEANKWLLKPFVNVSSDKNIKLSQSERLKAKNKFKKVGEVFSIQPEDVQLILEDLEKEFLPTRATVRYAHDATPEPELVASLVSADDDRMDSMEKSEGKGEIPKMEKGTSNLPAGVVVENPVIDSTKVFGGKKRTIDTSKIEEATILSETKGDSVLSTEAEHLFKEKQENQLADLLKKGTFKKIIVHGGSLRMTDEGETIATPQTDADAQFATFLFHLAEQQGGVNGVESIEFVPQGGSLEEGLHLDSGERDGIILETTGDKKYRAFFDHHAKEKKESTSATALTYDFFVKAGIFDAEFVKENPHLEKVRDFITAVDNFDHVTLKPGEKPRTQEYITQEYPNTLAATYKLLPFNFVLERFKKGIPANEPFSEEELHTVIKTKDGKGEQTLRDIVAKTKGIFDKSYWLALNRKKRAESIGVVDRTQELGKVFVDIERKDGTGRLGRGNEITRMRGFDTFVQWNELKKSFFISSAKDLSAAFEKIKPIAPGAKLIRGVMIVMPETGVNQRAQVEGTIDQFLLALDLIDAKDAEKAKELVQPVEIKKKKAGESIVSEEKKNEAMASVELLRVEREGIMNEFRRLKTEGLFTAEVKADIEQKLLAIKAKQEKALVVLEIVIQEERDAKKAEPKKKEIKKEKSPVISASDTKTDPEILFTPLEKSGEEAFWLQMKDESFVQKYVEGKLMQSKYQSSQKEKDDLLGIVRDTRLSALEYIQNAENTRKRVMSIEHKDKQYIRLQQIQTNLEQALLRLGVDLSKEIEKMITEYRSAKK